MPKYENAEIYRLICKDPTITDEYIGSTCNRYKRKQQHKSVCNNENDKYYNFPVYQCIRANGGFQNWDMIRIEPYPCNSKIELHMRERHWIEERQPTLNKNIPTRTEEEIRQYKKQYREEHKEIIKKKQNEKITCECGSQYTYANKNRHFKTHNHLKYLDGLNNSAIIIQRFFKKYL